MKRRTGSAPTSQEWVGGRPASVRPTGSPFVKQKRKAGSKKLGLDMDRIDDSYNHKARIAENQDDMTHLRLQLISAEAHDRYSAAKRIRRELNRLLEESLYLTHSWCLGCNNVLHNCQCKAN